MRVERPELETFDLITLSSGSVASRISTVGSAQLKASQKSASWVFHSWMRRIQDWKSGR